MDERTHARYMSDIAYFLSKMEAEPNSGYFIPIALAYNKLEKYDETIAMCKSAIERFPANCAAKTFLAEAYVYKGQFDLARDLLFDVTAEDDNNYKALKLLGIICKENGDTTDALKYLTGAYIRSPEDEDVRKMIEELGGSLNPAQIYDERMKRQSQNNVDSEEDEGNNNRVTYQLGDQIRRELFGTRIDERGIEVINNTQSGSYVINRLLADYDCLVNRNYTPVDNSNNATLELARITAIARERNLHYKINGYLDSYKIEYKSGNIVLTPSTTEYTNGDVFVSLSTDMGGIRYYFENSNIDEAYWPVNEDGTFGQVRVSRNDTLYVYSEDRPSAVRSILIDNIDEAPPYNVEITASNVTSSSFDLTVGARDGGGSGITRYIVYVKDAANEDYKPLEIPKYSSQETEKINISNRATKTTYNCYVEVYDAAGNVARSNTISVTTN